MPVVTLGLNHNSAPLAVRERVVIGSEMLDEALAELGERPGVREAVVLSTCNRTEIYAVLSPEATPQVLQRWLEDSHRLEHDWLSQFLYTHHGRAAVEHLLSVAAGLDSLIIGEPQILGQAKHAYHAGLRQGTVGQTLDRLFQHAFATAKHIRTDTDIGNHPVSVAFAAVSLARQIFGDMDRRTALLIGAGETIELTARHLRDQHIARLIIANRSPERARKLAEHHGGEGIALGDIPHFLDGTDIIVASTGSTLPILGKGSVETALKRRKHQPMFMVDIAVPRDIEPEVGELSDVYLYTIDDLREVIEDNLRSRQQAARQGEEIVQTHAEQFMGWVRSLDAVSTIRRYRQHAERQRDEVLRRARRRLARGDDPEVVLEYLARTLTGKLTHAPTVGMREAAREGGAPALHQGRRILGLPPEDDETP
ncbi:MAG: glutamyl-tRNA reductase [Ectothiorhodospiraceae bacterium]|jgi:glutamyl-tRNA reductase